MCLLKLFLLSEYRLSVGASLVLHGYNEMQLETQQGEILAGTTLCRPRPLLCEIIMTTYLHMHGCLSSCVAINSFSSSGHNLVGSINYTIICVASVTQNDTNSLINVTIQDPSNKNLANRVNIAPMTGEYYSHLLSSVSQMLAHTNVFLQCPTHL